MQSQSTGSPSKSAPEQPTPVAPGDDAPEGTPGTGEAVCPDCGGSGRAQGGAPCQNCAGSGVVTVGIGGG